MNHYGALIRLGLPIIVGQVGMIVLGFADTLMIGHHSTEELGAASVVNNLFNLCIIFSTGFSYGLTPVVGSLCGRGQKAEAGQALVCSLAANGLVALILMTVIPLVKPYYLTLLFSLPFVLWFNGFKQFTDGIGDTRTAMWVLLGGNAMNIAGNYVLIYGKLGFPELGLLGAGLSTLNARMAMVAAMAIIVYRGKRFVPYKRGIRQLGWSGKVFRRLNALGWPVGLQMGMETAAFSLSTLMVGWLGTMELAAHQIMLTLSQLTFMVFYGMGAAVAVRVSHYTGQGDYVGVRQTTYAGFRLILGLGCILTAAVFVLKGQVGGWFTDSAEVAAAVEALFLPFLIYQLGDGTQICFANALRGMADVKPMMGIAFISYFLIALPVGYVGGFVLNWGLPGVWTAFPFGLSTAGLLLWIRFRKITKGSHISY